MPSSDKPRGELGWMFQLLSAITSTLAIVALARHAFATWSLSAPLALVMDAYNATMQLLFGWAQPYLQAALTWFGSFLGWHPTLYSHWRDVLVLTALLPAGTVRAAWRRGTLRAALSGASVLAFVAIGTALFAGVLALQSNHLATQLMIAASFGLVALVTAALTMTLNLTWRAEGLKLSLVAIAVPVVATCLLALAFGPVPGLGLVGLAVIVVLIALLALVSDHDRGGEELDGSEGVLTRTVIGGFVGAFCFFAVDAGLKLLMG